MLISEVFGYGVDNVSEIAQTSRQKKLCPFRKTPCTKSSKQDPIGICTLANNGHAAALCPVRFLENDRIFKDAARIAFGENAIFAVFPEIRILKIKADARNSRERKIGKVDYLIGKIEGENIVDFAAVEVQAVYFSGTEIRTPLKYFLKHGRLDIVNSDRRPDFRSSAQKRLIPQLQLKVPVFRRWGKKFFVVVDTRFFAELPEFPQTTSANSELTWLAYGISKSGNDYHLGAPDIVFSEWDAIRNALREGVPPEPQDIIAEMQMKLDDKHKQGLKIIEIQAI